VAIEVLSYGRQRTLVSRKVTSRGVVDKLVAWVRWVGADLSSDAEPPAARRGRQSAACGRLAAAQPRGVQPIPDGVAVHAQLAGDLDQRPGPLGDAVGQVGLKVGKAELTGALGEVLVGGAAP
jgi:hypothetical protein